MSQWAETWAFEQRVKQSGAKFVLVALASFADVNGFCFPGQETLADMTGQGVTTVRAHLKTLEVEGLIKRTHRYHQTGKRTSDGYTLNAPADRLRPARVATERAALPANSVASLPASPAASDNDYRQDSAVVTPTLPAESAARLPAKSAGELSVSRNEQEITELPKPTVSEGSAKNDAPPASGKTGRSKSGKSTADPRTSHPAIQACRTIASQFPPLEIYDDIIEAVGREPDIGKLTDCRKAYVTAGKNRNGWTWVTDWYMNGIPEWYRKKEKLDDTPNGKHGQQPVPSGMGPRASIVANRNYGKWDHG